MKRKYHRTYTAEQRAEIERLGAKGVGDTEIARRTGVPFHIINPITTKYWHNKMKNKIQEDEIIK